MEECTEGKFLSLSAWHDGEVAGDEARQLEAHLRTCGACQLNLLRLTSLTNTLQRRFANNDIPTQLRDSATTRLTRNRWRRGPLLIAAAVICVGAFVLVLAAGAKQRALRARISEEIVTRHLAGFARPEPCDIDSPDAKVVSAWLSEHAGYPVSVALPADMELLGGRVCHLCGSPTAALMLRHDGTPLTVFVPAAGSEAAREAERLAESGRSCRRGPRDFSVCACATPQPMLAVAEAEPALVDHALSGLP